MKGQISGHHSTVSASASLGKVPMHVCNELLSNRCCLGTCLEHRHSTAQHSTEFGPVREMTWNKNVCLLSWLTASVLLVVEGKWRKWEQVLESQAGMFDHQIEQSCWGMFFRGPRIITRQTHMREAPLIHAILVFSRSLKPFLERCTHVHARTHICLRNE